MELDGILVFHLWTFVVWLLGGTTAVIGESTRRHRRRSCHSSREIEDEGHGVYVTVYKGTAENAMSLSIGSWVCVVISRRDNVRNTYVY
jgi:hypothetical protein